MKHAHYQCVLFFTFCKYLIIKRSVIGCFLMSLCNWLIISVFHFVPCVPWGLVRFGVYTYERSIFNSGTGWNTVKHAHYQHVSYFTFCKYLIINRSVIWCFLMGFRNWFIISVFYFVPCVPWGLVRFGVYTYERSRLSGSLAEDPAMVCNDT
jgi:hypothetical protein